MVVKRERERDREIERGLTGRGRPDGEMELHVIWRFLPLSKYKVTAEREKTRERKQSKRWRDKKKTTFFWQHRARKKDNGT